MSRHGLSVVPGLAAVSLLCMACTNPANHVGTATETENVAGVLYNMDGSRAAGANVMLLPADYVPAVGSPETPDSARSTLTDDTGGYVIGPLPANTYNLFFSAGGYLAYRDSVRVAPESPPLLPSDTLKTPGSITGTVQLPPGEDPGAVSILLIGTAIWTVPEDSTGRFEFDDIAEGDYVVRIQSASDVYMPMDTILHIASGETDTLPGEFVLLHAVSFITPDSSSVWYAGASFLVRWTPDNPGLEARINLYLYKGMERQSLIAANEINSGAFTWSIPPALAAGNGYRIGIANYPDGAILGFSDTFIINGVNSARYGACGNSVIDGDRTNETFQ